MGKLNSFQHHCQAFAALLIIEVRDPQNLYSSNYLPYNQMNEDECLIWIITVSEFPKIRAGLPSLSVSN